MGTIIEFPADAASRRPGPTMDGAPREGMGVILILPVVRIGRQVRVAADELTEWLRGGGSGLPATYPDRRDRRAAVTHADRPGRHKPKEHRGPPASPPLGTTR